MRAALLSPALRFSHDPSETPRLIKQLSHALTLLSPRNAARRLTVEPVMKVKNAAEFFVEKEDHTLGNLLRMFVNRGNYPAVRRWGGAAAR